MQVDLDHVLFWMDAVRSSGDPARTLESFWRGQIKSKEWLIEKLFLVMDFNKSPSIVIYGGWNGVLASLLFQTTYFKPSHITSVDIDLSCEDVANTVNKIEEIAGRFTAVTGDMCKTIIDADIVINTSCEHITQDQYDTWLSNTPDHSLIVVQSNNYRIDEHVRIADSLEHFKQQSCVNVLWKGELELPLYTRYMIIGKQQ